MSLVPDELTHRATQFMDSKVELTVEGARQLVRELLAQALMPFGPPGSITLAPVEGPAPFSLRDRFAAAALVHMMTTEDGGRKAAREAYRIADEMMRVRSETAE